MHENTRNISVKPRPMLRLAAIRDCTNNLRRKRVAEEVDAQKKVERNGGGPDRRRYRSHDGGIERSGIEEEEELGDEEHWNRPTVGAKKYKRTERQRQRDAPVERHQVQRPMIRPQPPLRKPSADERSQNAVNHRPPHLQQCSHRQPTGRPLG